MFCGFWGNEINCSGEERNGSSGDMIRRIMLAAYWGSMFSSAFMGDLRNRDLRNDNYACFLMLINTPVLRPCCCFLKSKQTSSPRFVFFFFHWCCRSASVVILHPSLSILFIDGRTADPVVVLCSGMLPPLGCTNSLCNSRRWQTQHFNSAYTSLGTSQPKLIIFSLKQASRWKDVGFRGRNCSKKKI